MPKQPAKKTGPAEDRLKIDGDWKDAMKAATNKPKPKTGWPKK
jgi:hypothetical protein